MGKIEWAYVQVVFDTAELAVAAAGAHTCRVTKKRQDPLAEPPLLQSGRPR